MTSEADRREARLQGEPRLGRAAMPRGREASGIASGERGTRASRASPFARAATSSERAQSALSGSRETPAASLERPRERPASSARLERSESLGTGERGAGDASGASVSVCSSGEAARAERPVSREARPAGGPRSGRAALPRGRDPSKKRASPVLVRATPVERSDPRAPTTTRLTPAASGLAREEA